MTDKDKDYAMQAAERIHANQGWKRRAPQEWFEQVAAIIRSEVSEPLANAEYIVRCVNSHQALCDALQNLLFELRQKGPAFDPSMRALRIEQAESALRSAKEGQ